MAMSGIKRKKKLNFYKKNRKLILKVKQMKNNIINFRIYLEIEKTKKFLLN